MPSDSSPQGELITSHQGTAISRVVYGTDPKTGGQFKEEQRQVLRQRAADYGLPKGGKGDKGSKSHKAKGSKGKGKATRKGPKAKNKPSSQFAAKPLFRRGPDEPDAGGAGGGSCPSGQASHLTNYDKRQHRGGRKRSRGSQGHQQYGDEKRRWVSSVTNEMFSDSPEFQPLIPNGLRAAVKGHLFSLTGCSDFNLCNWLINCITSQASMSLAEKAVSGTTARFLCAAKSPLAGLRISSFDYTSQAASLGFMLGVAKGSGYASLHSPIPRSGARQPDVLDFGANDGHIKCWQEHAHRRHDSVVHPRTLTRYKGLACQVGLAPGCSIQHSPLEALCPRGRRTSRNRIDSRSRQKNSPL